MSPIAARLTAQLLAGPAAPAPVAVAQRLLAVQETRAGYAWQSARTSGLCADVDLALTEGRSLLRAL